MPFYQSDWFPVCSNPGTNTFDREMKPLYRIQDNYEKIVLTLDKLSPGNYDGIKVVYLMDFLTGSN